MNAQSALIALGFGLVTDLYSYLSMTRPRGLDEDSAKDERRCRSMIWIFLGQAFVKPMYYLAVQVGPWTFLPVGIWCFALAGGGFFLWRFVADWLLMAKAPRVGWRVGLLHKQRFYGNGWGVWWYIPGKEIRHVRVEWAIFKLDLKLAYEANRSDSTYREYCCNRDQFIEDLKEWIVARFHRSPLLDGSYDVVAVHDDLDANLAELIYSTAGYQNRTIRLEQPILLTTPHREINIHPFYLVA